MKRLTILCLALASTVATAECYVRSDIRLSRQGINAGPTDFQKIVAPDSNGFKCSVQYRIHIGENWYTAEGSAVANTESEACTRASDVGLGTVLLEVEPSQVRADTQMVCSDVPEIRVRRVRVGEMVWESETEMHTNPAERPYFNYKGSQCRLFVERQGKDQNLYLYQGVMCKLDQRPDSKWQVIDKY